MADSKMKQATSAFCGVTKSVVTNRGRLYKVELPEVVEDKESKVVQVKCVVCSQGFTAMKYLRQHWLFKHEAHFLSFLSLGSHKLVNLICVLGWGLS